MKVGTRDFIYAPAYVTVPQHLSMQGPRCTPQRLAARGPVETTHGQKVTLMLEGDPIASIGRT